MEKLSAMNHIQLEELCFSLAGTTVDVKWSHDLCYLVGGKMYCVANLDGRLTVSMKVLAEDFGGLTAREGIIPAPYMAKNNWIFVEESKALTMAEWKRYVRQSYALVFAKLPKKVKERITNGINHQKK